MEDAHVARKRGKPGEISEHNPDAVRGPNGIWNETSLPVTEWENPAYRVVVPERLQRVLKLEAPVLRWEEAKRRKVFGLHPEVQELDFSDGNFWANWDRAGQEPTKRIALNVFFSDENRTYIAAISRHHGETTITTVFSPRHDWLVRRLKAGDQQGGWSINVPGREK